MQNFVKDRDRAGSPQNAQAGRLSTVSKRQAIAANARIPLKKGTSTQQSVVQSAIPSRGLGIVENAQSRQSNQDQAQKRDPYDTDAESLDTTVNHSVIQVEGDQKNNQQHQQHGEVIEIDDESEGDEDVSEEEQEFEGYEWTEEDIQLIEQAGLQNISREGQLSFLQQVRLNGFPTVDGDSYPTTTNGDPTEWEGAQEPILEEHNHRVLISPSPQRATAAGHFTRPLAPSSLQRDYSPNEIRTNMGIPKSNLFQQSASLRGQQRSTKQLAQPVGTTYQSAVSAPLTIQHPNNGQTTQRQHIIPLQHVQQHPSGSARFQLQPLMPMELPAPLKRPSSAHFKAEPSVQSDSVRQTIGKELPAALVSDYDHETLLAMKYDQLSKEDFDTDPRAALQVLTEDILQKPLTERLEFVQKNLDAGKQSEFFSSLPILEWEESGDWFLEQFQKIIQRTREARQNKRKLAQEFENEVETRYNHVSKKQNQVEEALRKMKSQGEGLVPKSPRSSKSPKPKKG